MRDSIVDKALTLFYQSKKDNPFLKIADFELARYHLNKKNIDSAEFYSKNAFKLYQEIISTVGNIFKF